VYEVKLLVNDFVSIWGLCLMIKHRPCLLDYEGKNTGFIRSLIGGNKDFFQFFSTFVWAAYIIVQNLS